MGQRLDLQAKFVAIPGVARVYFQEPSNTVMVYPCIRYELADVDIVHADNLPFKTKRKYQVTVIDQNPDSTIPFAVELMPSVRFVRFYAKDQLNHTVYELYF